jgi:hypothetical protein
MFANRYQYQLKHLMLAIAFLAFACWVFSQLRSRGALGDASRSLVLVFFVSALPVAWAVREGRHGKNQVLAGLAGGLGTAGVLTVASLILGVGGGLELTVFLGSLLGLSLFAAAWGALLGLLVRRAARASQLRTRL